MMKYNNIQRLLSAALLFAFTVPISLADAVYNQSALYSSAMPLSGNIKLTDKNNNITLSLRNSDVKQVLHIIDLMNKAQTAPNSAFPSDRR